MKDFLMKKEVLLIVALGFIAFSNTLFNGFIGDDEVFIVENTFYQSWQNVPSLFSAEYFPGGDGRSESTGPYYSGSVAYRPVLSATFFLDYWLWQLKPGGYHLTNIVLHVVNSVLVYLLIFYLLKNNSVAFFSALLFCVHPVQSEAVANIGYRADLLTAFYLLLSLLCLLKHDKEANGRVSFAFSVFFYFLAVFTKESAVVLIFLVILYDLFFRKISLREALKNLFGRYLPFIAVLLFYLYVYIFVFPNISLHNIGLLGGSLKTHSMASLWIFLLYLKNLMFPFLVKMVPPLYAPVTDNLIVLKVALFLMLLAGLFYLLRKDPVPFRRFSFFLLWFLVALLPMLNIFPNANPMAFRYLYLPSIGFFAGLSILLECLETSLIRTAFPRRSGIILKTLIVGLCVVYLVSFNFLWRSNYSVANELIEHYPDHYKAYEILGFQFFKDKKYDLATVSLLKSIQLGHQDPRVFRMLEEIKEREGED